MQLLARICSYNQTLQLLARIRSYKHTLQLLARIRSYNQTLQLLARIRSYNQTLQLLARICSYNQTLQLLARIRRPRRRSTHSALAAAKPKTGDSFVTTKSTWHLDKTSSRFGRCGNGLRCQSPVYSSAAENCMAAKTRSKHING